jgi:uncharacterized membrane protein
MQRNQKILLGILSFIPLISIITYLVIMFKFVFNVMANKGQDLAEPTEFLSSFLPAIILVVIGALLGTFLFIYFLILAIKDKSSKENDRILWVLLLVLVSPLAFPLYWYVRLWTNPNFSTEENDLGNYNN